MPGYKSFWNLDDLQLIDFNKIREPDHFILYANTESQCCISEINIMLYVSYTSM